MDKIIFKEIQRSKIIIIVTILLTTFIGIVISIQIYFSKPIGNHPAPTLLLIGIFLAAIWSTRLKLLVIITESEIHVRLGLLANKRVAINDIKAFNVRKYDAANEFMGRGLRYNNIEKCYTMSGDDALEIELKNGEKFLIGTQKPGEILSAIVKLLPNS